MVVKNTVKFCFLVMLLLLSSCFRNQEDQGHETIVDLSQEYFAEMITAESEQGIDTLIYTKVFTGNDSVVSWQSLGLNIGINVMLDVDSNSSMKSYHFQYYELNAILYNRFNILLNNSSEQYSNHRKVNQLRLGSQASDSFLLIYTDKGWVSASADILQGLKWFTSVMRDRKKLDASTKLIHRTYYYLGDEVNVITTEL